MTAHRRIDRRRLLALLGGTAVSLALDPRSGVAQVDQGIGGTGAVPPPTDKDQGIGGTGVIGTIRRFGSIVVNGLRIGYPNDVPVTLDGEPATATALRLGQVVRVVVWREGGAFTTRHIAVTSEVVGRIDTISAREMTVLGQTISTAELKGSAAWKVGDHVGVSGLRRPDGVIVASLLEQRPKTVNRVAGPVVRGADGTLTIGHLPVSGLAPSFVGQRALVEGSPDGQRFVATRARTEQQLLGPGIVKLSVEAFVERRGAELRLGSGLTVSGAAARLRTGPAVRAVITTGVGHNGRLKVQSLRLGAADLSRPRKQALRDEITRGGGGPGSATNLHGRPAGAEVGDLGGNRIGGRRPEWSFEGRGAFGGPRENGGFGGGWSHGGSGAGGPNLGASGFGPGQGSGPGPWRGRGGPR